jgi:hypothetical protein
LEAAQYLMIPEAFFTFNPSDVRKMMTSLFDFHFHQGRRG